jgi:hypothetical protein
MFAPGNDPFYQSINRSLQQGLLGRTVLFLSYSLLSTETIDGSVIAPVDEARAEQFVSQVDPTRLSGLSVVEIRFPNAKLENDPKLLSNYAADAKVWSADEETERAALISLDGKDYVIGFTLLRYGDSWGVARQSSGLLGTSVIGVATPTTPSDFDALTSGG